MLILRYVFKFVRLLNSETSISSLALALTLGMVLGLVPFLTLHAMCVLLVCLFFRVNLTAMLLSMGLFKLGALATQATLHRAGVALLEDGRYLEIWRFLYNAPVLSYCMLNNSIVLASTLAAAVLLLPMFLASCLAVKVYRSHIQGVVAKSRIVTGFKALKMYKLYRRLGSPLG
jgi:uncharacterized protein (TIGR03546 family)